MFAEKAVLQKQDSRGEELALASGGWDGLIWCCGWRSCEGLSNHIQRLESAMVLLSVLVTRGELRISSTSFLQKQEIGSRVF